ncbi:MAG TPA: Smr/MutS family protein [Devosiaceae bacterium]|jgi:DNA-nicking Smr family endonuclease|nr:Smr/MutS family protein [Devosiaceae bacterium]
MAGRDPKRRHVLADWHLWTEVARTVSPLHRQGALTLDSEPLPLPRPPEPAKKAAARPTMPSYRPEGRPGPQPGRDELDPRLRRRLGRGQIAIDGTIDLHGMRQAEAHAALRRFLHARVARGDRTVLVITGKGLRGSDGGTAIAERGVLRAMLPIWLGERELAPLVSGWDVAARGHGGEGAFYVRLRRPEASR